MVATSGRNHPAVNVSHDAASRASVLLIIILAWEQRLLDAGFKVFRLQRKRMGRLEKRACDPIE